MSAGSQGDIGGKSAVGVSSEDARTILDRAAGRARASDLAYAGAVTPAEAHRLAQLGAAIIIDVRTRPEWEFVGRVADAPLIEWRHWGATQPNPDFLVELSARVPPEATLLFLCRSGVRSHNAAQAAASAGFAAAFNILEGFEGDLDADGRRGTRGGWRYAGLPWIQG
jgi:rhodanese-related sulfurtransferase